MVCQALSIIPSYPSNIIATKRVYVMYIPLAEYPSFLPFKHHCNLKSLNFRDLLSVPHLSAYPSPHLFKHHCIVPIFNQPVERSNMAVLRDG